MRRIAFWLLLATSLLVATPRTLVACPMCSEAVPNTEGGDEDDATRESRAYNNSIYLMIATPYLAFTGVSFWVYRGLRRKAVLEQQLTEEPRP
jgi:hypothetical protein